MTRSTLLVAALAAATVVAASCADQPTAPTTDAARVAAPSDASAQKAPPGLTKPGRAALLTSVPVTGTLSDGGSFTGTFTAQRIDYDADGKTLLMTGVLTGTATDAAGVMSTVTQEFSRIPFTLGHSAATQAAALYQHTQTTATCSILFLDLGPLHLDLLGLTVDLNEVVLALNAVAGAGNLLGNLLCAVVNLLDLGAAIAAIQNLLNIINTILAGLQPPAAAIGGVGLLTPGFFAPDIAFSPSA